MAKDIQRLGKTDISTGEILYLLNLDNGRVLPWTALLAVKKNMVDCTEDGVPINPKDVLGNHPWILKQTKALRDRMAGAGATVDTLEQMGRQLTEDGNRKFKSLEYQRAKQYRIEGGQGAGWTGFDVRLLNKIDRNVAKARKELRMMVFEAENNILNSYEDAVKSLKFIRFASRR